jgi:Flp pilus assembly protein TadD
MTFLRSCTFINILIFVLICGITGCTVQDKQQSLSKEKTSKDRRMFELQKQKRTAIFDEGDVLKGNPEMSAEEYERLGDNYIRQNNLVMAFMQYNKALSLDPGRTDIRYKVGQLLLMRGMADEAMMEFEKILKIDPDNALAYEGRGTVLLGKGKLDESEDNFKWAVNLDPKLWKVHTSLGIIYDRREQYDAAINSYHKAIAINPDSSVLFNDLGVSNFLKGDYEKSVDALSKALKIEPTNSRFYNNLGLVLCKLGRYEDAFKAFRSGGDEASAYNNIGYIYLTEKKYKEAINAFEKAIELRQKFYLKAHENIEKARAASEGLAETYVESLKVSDGTAGADSDTVTESTGNLVPMADGGFDQSVYVGDKVILDGSGSIDPDGDSLTFSWLFATKPLNSEATLDDITLMNPDFIVDVAGIYIVSLTVNDGTVDSVPSMVVINTINVAPIADGGSDQSAHIGDKVILNGSNSSDPDGDQLTFNWSFTTKPSNSEATLDDTTSMNPVFVADIPGAYVINLVVNDGTAESKPDMATINIINIIPIADGGPDQSAHTGDKVMLNGNNSSDLDGNLLTFDWTFTSRPSGSTAALDDTTSMNPAFKTDIPGTYVISLTVNDGIVDSVPNMVTINTINIAPVAGSGPDLTVNVGDLVILDGSNSSDPDGDQLTFNWTFTSRPFGSTVTLNDTTSMNPAFKTDIPGTYVIGLTVNDGTLDSDNIDVVTISAVEEATTSPVKGTTTSPVEEATTSPVEEATTSISKGQEEPIKEINLSDKDSGAPSNPDSQKVLKDKVKLGD